MIMHRSLLAAIGLFAFAHVASAQQATVIGSPAIGSITGLGTGVATLLSGTSSGSGGPAGTTSPTLVTPVLGTATATSINKTAITAPATGSTLAIADGKTFTASNTLTITGTDSTSLNINAVTTLNSGTYTPTATGVLNTASVTAGKAQWLRVGNTVTVSGLYTLTATAGSATMTEITLTLPVASTIATADLAGAGAQNDEAAAVAILGLASPGRADLYWKAATTSSRVYPYTYTYEVK